MLLALASIQFGRLGSMFGKPKELFADVLGRAQLFSKISVHTSLC
jgi:hypothetical protein